MVSIYAWSAIYLCNLQQLIKKQSWVFLSLCGICEENSYLLYSESVKVFDRFICLLACLWNHSARDLAHLKLFLVHDSRSTGKKEPKWNAWRRSYAEEWRRSGVRSSMEKWSDDTWSGGRRQGKGRGKPRAEAGCTVRLLFLRLDVGI